MKSNAFANKSPSLMLQEHLGLLAPVTIADLKSGYRRRAKELHPDINPHGTELFKTFQAAYEWLTSPSILPIIAVEGEVEQVAQTVDGVPLSELGLGFDNTKNGVDCTDCNHLGYKKVVRERFHFCTNCSGVGYAYSNPCNACKGTGKFTQERSKKVVDCLRCKGVGSFACQGATRCTAPGCNRGYVTHQDEKVEYHTCYRCHGVGELEIFNPVLPKGLLSSLRR